MSLNRSMMVLDGILACLVASVAAWHSPYLQFDGSVVLAGTAFAAPVFWRGHWSWRFLMATAVTAYFFRCVAIYMLGTDAVRTIALRDIGMGVLAVVGAYYVRLLIRKYTGESGSTASQQSIQERGEPGPGRSDDEVIGEEADGTATTREGEEEVWSPPQFTLKAVFVLTLACSGLLAVGVTGGPRVAYVVLLMGLFWFLIERCVRLVRR